MSQPNIDFIMNMTKEYLGGKIDEMTYFLDNPYCDLIYKCLYDEGIMMYNQLSETKLKKLI